MIVSITVGISIVIIDIISIIISSSSSSRGELQQN